MDVRIEFSGAIRTVASGAEAVRAGAGVLNTHIQSQTTLRLGLYALAALFMIVAAFLVVFTPNDRQVVSSIIAAALFAVAAGCAGFGTFAIKTPFGSVQAGETLKALDGLSQSSKGEESRRRRAARSKAQGNIEPGMSVVSNKSTPPVSLVQNSKTPFGSVQAGETLKALDGLSQSSKGEESRRRRAARSKAQGNIEPGMSVVSNKSTPPVSLVQNS